MRGVGLLVVFVAVSGCLEPSGLPADEETGLAMVQIESGTFDLGLGTQPFLVELETSVEARISVEGAQMGPGRIPAAAGILRPEDWSLRGDCRAVTPVLDAFDGHDNAVQLEAGRYVVVPAVQLGRGSVSFGGGPLMEPPGVAGSGGSGWSGSSSLVAVNGGPREYTPDGEELVAAFLVATPNGPELDVTHAVTLGSDAGICGSDEDARPDEVRYASVWAWVSDRYTVTFDAQAMPVPPGTESGALHLEWSPE